jgi:threonine 3-dehydrogenase
MHRIAARPCLCDGIVAECRRSMRILVTGGAGQVGTDLLGLLHERGEELSCFDLSPKTDAVPDAVQWRRGSITDPSEVMDCVREFRPEVVYHFAALLSATGENHPHRAWSVNLEGTRNLLEAARLFGVRQVMFASTIAVFGPGLPDPVPNVVPLQPTTMYGITKVAGEMLGAYYDRKWGLDFRGVRFPGLINAGIPGGGTTDYALFMYVDGIRYGKYSCFVGPKSTVPMMYMPDALRALLELSAAPKERLRHNIYNIAAMSPTAQEFADAVTSRVPGVKITFDVDPRRQAILDSWPDRVDDTAARNDWGWRPAYDLARMSDDLIPKVRALLG